MLLFALCRCHKIGKKYHGVEGGGIAGSGLVGEKYQARDSPPPVKIKIVRNLYAK